MAALIYDEVELFGACLLLGMGLALVYDFVRVCRLLFRHRDWLVDIEDLAFWIFTAWMVFCTLFYYNRGALRGYAFLGMFLGVLCYSLTVSRLVLYLAGKFVPWWNRGKEICKTPFRKFRIFLRKALKNAVAQVTIALKSR